MICNSGNKKRQQHDIPLFRGQQAGRRVAESMGRWVGWGWREAALRLIPPCISEREILMGVLVGLCVSVGEGEVGGGGGG